MRSQTPLIDKTVLIDACAEYRPGDLPPEGYLDWHEWAEVQRKAGIKQVMCGRCALWRTPQELSAIVDVSHPMDRRGRRVECKSLVCAKCAGKAIAAAGRRAGR